MKKNITDGVWATMITPFTEDDKIDYDAAGALIEWYINNGVDGVFAVCQSSEMFWLSFEEKYALAKFVIGAVDGRSDKIEVVVSGNTEEDIDAQIKQARALAELGPDAVVFVSNRLEYSGGFAANVDKIINAMPEDTALGIYECPYPSKRLLTDDECGRLAKTGRFAFLKDTSCDAGVMRRRAEIAAGTGFKLYNANSATLLDTLEAGYNGYCGVMANFQPDLYAWLCKNFSGENNNAKKAKRVAQYLAITSVIEGRNYPCCAKRYLSLFKNFKINQICRSGSGALPQSVDYELRAFDDISQEIREYIK